MIPFPDIDPIAISIGPLAIRWYALAYIAGFVLGWRLMRRFAAVSPRLPDGAAEKIDDLLTWAIFGVILGGRAGYVLFYGDGYFWQHPGAILAVWQGGMSFHGGMCGMILATILYCRRAGLPFWPVIDLAAIAAPIGLFLGRAANFINGELYGRAAEVPWAVIFPGGGPLPRHPSQLYEAGLEGIGLFVILFFLAKRTAILSRPAALSGLFLAGYGLSRIIAEHFREPDAQIGYLSGGLTMGQALSLPMLLGGASLAWFALSKKRGAA